MTSHLSLEEPFVLLNLPKPFGPHSKIQAAGVSLYSGRSKKQQPEIAAAVDGEGIYIYSVESPKLISSYALPPETRFVSAPLSFIWRRKNSISLRVTIVACRTESTGSSRLICLSEDWRRRPLSSTGPQAVTKQELKLPDDQLSILRILAQPSGEDSNDLSEAFRILVVHHGDKIDCFNGNMSTLLWTYAWPSDSDLEACIEFADIESLEQAQKTLLVDRPDITSNLMVAEGSRSVLVMVRSQQRELSKERSVHIAGLPTEHSNKLRLRSANISMHKLSELPKPQVKLARWDARLSFQLHKGSFFSLISEALVCWRKQKGNLHWDQELARGFSGYVPISSTMALGLSSRLGHAAIHDFQWHSVHAIIPVNNQSQTGSKRDRDTSSANLDGNTDFVNYNPQTGTAVALARDRLIALRISLNPDSHKRRRVGDINLAEAVGAGVQETQDAAFASVRQIVRSYVVQDANNDLDEFMAKELNIAYTRGRTTHESNGESNGAVEGETSHDSVQWSFPTNTSSLLQRGDAKLARVVIQEITQQDDDRLRFRCFPQNTMQWLATIGELSKYDDGQLMEALAHLDPTLSKIGVVLDWPFHLDIREVVKALEIVIDSLDNPIDHMVTIQQITNGEHDEDDRSVNDASAAAENDLAFAIASLNHGTAIRGGLMRSVSSRLDKFPASDIVRTFRFLLSPRKIVFFINLLRIELADGGWTTRYTDETYESEEEDGPSDSSIGIIMKLLNASIDAVGAVGWNVALSADKQLNTDEMILVLRAEISAALDGGIDCQAIEAALLDFTKYCNDLDGATLEGAGAGSGKERRRRAKESAAKRRKSKVAVDPLRNPGFLEDEDVEDTLLPLGCRVDRIETTRTTKGGRVEEKSKGAIGQELSMRVGRYSIDRIRV